MDKIKRPKQTVSTTHLIETGCGHFYITIGRDNGNIIEVFATLGKAGGCAHAQAEALTRAISLGLKYKVPVEEYAEELEGIKCPNQTWDDKTQIMSCADAISKVLRSAKTSENSR